MEQNEARRLELVEGRQSELENAVVRMSESANRMSDAVAHITEGMKKLIELEVSHGETKNGLDRAFEDIEGVEKRVCDIEKEMPTLKLSRLVVAMCVGGILVFAGNKIWEAAFPHLVSQQQESMGQGRVTGP